MNVRTGIDVNNPEKERNEAYHQRSDEHGVHERSAESSTDYQQPFQGLIARGQRANFPFADYHPPESFDFFLELGKRTRHTSDNVDSYIGSILLFSRLDGPELPREAADLVERLRPFFTYVFSDYSARIDSRDSGGDGRMYQFIERVAADAGLSPQEHRVLMLGFLGHPYKDMAEILHVSVNTVQSHISSIYRKTGVSKIGEIYARYFAGLEMTGERSEPENTIGRL